MQGMIYFYNEFGTTELSILILDIATIIHQWPCCYVVTISKIGQLYPVFDIAQFDCILFERVCSGEKHIICFAKC